MVDFSSALALGLLNNPHLSEENSICCFHSIFGDVSGALSSQQSSEKQQDQWDDSPSKHHITIQNIKNEPQLGYKVCYDKNSYNAQMEVQPEEFFDKSVGRTRLKCPNCFFLTDNKGNLTQHMKVHEKSQGNAVYQCESCEFNTKYKNSIKGHLARHEISIKKKAKGKKRKKRY